MDEDDLLDTNPRRETDLRYKLQRGGDCFGGGSRSHDFHRGGQGGGFRHQEKTRDGYGERPFRDFPQQAARGERPPPPNRPREDLKGGTSRGGQQICRTKAGG